MAQAGPTIADVIRAKENHDRVFAIFSAAGGECTHGEHCARARRMALWLISRYGRGWKKGIRVMVAAPTSPDLLAAISGSWLAGAVVAPVEAQQTEESFLDKLRQLKPEIVLLDEAQDASGSRRRAAQDFGCALVESVGSYAGADDGEVPVPVAVDDPALVIFTSGSTGASKGVVLSHRNLLVGGRNVAEAKRLVASDRALCVLPLSHLNGLVTTYLAPLMTGGSVVFFQKSFNPVTVLKSIDRYGCTWFSAVPAQYAALMKPPVSAAQWSLASLRFCRSASSKLNPRLRSEFEAHYGVPVIETMGMSETTGQIFANPLPPGTRKDGSVGCPRGFEVRIVKDDGTECEIGREGEIQVRGGGLMLGYLDSDAETAKAYDAGWLKSGDLGKRDADNYFYITGRKKDIAIFCGVNISLTSLEQAVLNADLVEDIGCIAEEEDDFGERVVAYVVANQDASDYEGTGVAVLKTMLKYLPSRLACKEVRFIDALPRIGVGKIAKAKLGQATVLHKVNLMQVVSFDARHLERGGVTRS